MGYVAVTGGQEAIQVSIQLLKEYRSKGERPVDIGVLRDRMGLLIDRIMSEAGLYAPDYAALARRRRIWTNGAGSLRRGCLFLRQRSFRTRRPGCWICSGRRG